MNKFQKICVVWAIVLSLLTLFPPFIYRYKTSTIEFISERTWGFLFYPPEDKQGKGMAVDFGILFVEILFVSICFIGIIIATKKVPQKLQVSPLEETSDKKLKEDLERYIEYEKPIN